MTPPPRNAALKLSFHATLSGAMLAMTQHRAFVYVATIIPMYPEIMLVAPPATNANAVKNPTFPSNPDAPFDTSTAITAPNTAMNITHILYSAAKNALAPS